MNNEPEFPIDFVITWVDGSDPVWREKKERYQGEQKVEANSEQRYRDFGTLKYVFRSISKYANWVNKIWLITDHQVPEWLKKNNRIRVVDHKDFIPYKYLPTFNSNVIELNLWRISDLSEHFVLLNDDFLFIKKTSKRDFFTSNGFPKDTSAQSVLMPRDDFSHIPVNNISLINQQFSKREWLKKNWKTAFSLKNGIVLNTFSLILSPLPYFTRFFDPHVGSPYLKKNFVEVWRRFPQQLNQTSLNKFRELNEVSHWLVRYYQIVTGQTVSRSYKFGKYLNITDTNELSKVLKFTKNNMIVLNDNVDDSQKYEKAVESMKILNSFFDAPSEFEG
ncbi:Stealth CR1 domain-containing protein [Leuconostoc mesenteroides]|uniref:Stealth CR1 domain-containing protein n=1 Tax=Leuconostoc mesenteroides TaxID=1245 RepID=UPI0032DEA561